MNLVECAIYQHIGCACDTVYFLAYFSDSVALFNVAFSVAAITVPWCL